jgi:hypothetical protein
VLAVQGIGRAPPAGIRFDTHEGGWLETVERNI